MDELTEFKSYLNNLEELIRKLEDSDRFGHLEADLNELNQKVEDSVKQQQIDLDELNVRIKKLIDLYEDLPFRGQEEKPQSLHEIDKVVDGINQYEKKLNDLTKKNQRLTVMVSKIKSSTMEASKNIETEFKNLKMNTEGEIGLLKEYVIKIMDQDLYTRKLVTWRLLIMWLLALSSLVISIIY